MSILLKVAANYKKKGDITRKKGLLEVYESKIVLKPAIGIARLAGVGGLGEGESIPFEHIIDITFRKKMLAKIIEITTDYGIVWEIGVDKEDTFRVIQNLWKKIR